MSNVILSNVQQRQARLKQEIARFVEILRSQTDVERALVFGSLTSGKLHEWSDIDIIIIQNTEIPFQQRIREMRKKLRPTVATDIFVYTPKEFAHLLAERPFFQQQLHQAKLIYER